MSRHSRSYSSLSHSPNAVRQNDSRAAAAESSVSYSPTVTAGGQAKINVVTRVAIEGKAKQGQDGAAIKMYLKMSIPLDSVVPGATVPLFSEENVKILTSQVHPLDSNSVPYSFSSTSSPLLHNAARALNLPARSSETFYSAFNLSQPQNNGSTQFNPSSKATKHTESTPPVDPHFTGHILVSGYHISYVLPKQFPRNRGNEPRMESELHDLSRSSYRMRRLSVGEKSTAQFIAAIDMWVPFVSRPPRAPYLLSIPTPRCLHNQIKLRIFPPSNASSSYASLSSIEDDGSSWDLASDPHVTRSATARLARANSYTHFADDESSDSSTAGFSDGCGIQGTFPSAERVRVRWAKPIKTIAIPGHQNDDRRRVGVKDVKGEMTCIVQRMKDAGRTDTDGIQMHVEYRGTCKGVWFPGVATLLGMDVSLEAKGSEVSWLNEMSSQWEVSGGPGYTGFHVNAGSPSKQASHGSSFDFDSSRIKNPTTTAKTLLPQSANGLDRPAVSTASSHSLLRAPLPVHHVADYSFEDSHASFPDSASPPGTFSSMSSVPALASMGLSSVPPPSTPFTLHININELLPPAKNIFTFTISGTIILKPRNIGVSVQDAHGPDDKNPGSYPVVLPRFTVLAADTEIMTTVVRNELDGDTTAIEVYNPTGDIYKDPQSRKTVLRKGGFTRCGDEGGRICLKDIGVATVDKNAIPINPSRSPIGKTAQPMDLSGLISNAQIIITPLLSHEHNNISYKYAVRIKLDAPVQANSEWLEFGLPRAASMAPNDPEPHVQVISATVDGCAVKHEAYMGDADFSGSKADMRVPFENIGGREWVTWIKVYIGKENGKCVIISYIVEENTHKASEGFLRWSLSRPMTTVPILLPTFTLPIGFLETKLDLSTNLDIRAVECNLPHYKIIYNGRKFYHHCVVEFFSPRMQVSLREKPDASAPSRWRVGMYFLLTWMLIVLPSTLYYQHVFTRELVESKNDSAIPAVTQSSEPTLLTTTVTTTATVYTEQTLSTTTVTTTATAYTTIFIPTVTTSVTLLKESQSPVPREDISSLHSSEESLSSHDNSFPEDISSPHSSDSEESLSSYDDDSSPEDHGLITLTRKFAFSWMHWEAAQDSVHSGLERVTQAMEIVWNFFWNAYHYPLDPS